MADDQLKNLKAERKVLEREYASTREAEDRLGRLYSMNRGCWEYENGASDGLVVADMLKAAAFVAEGEWLPKKS
jgi:hypothetical protein